MTWRGSEAVASSYLRLMDSCIMQLEAQGLRGSVTRVMKKKKKKKKQKKDASSAVTILIRL